LNAGRSDVSSVVVVASQSWVKKIYVGTLAVRAQNWNIVYMQ